MAMDHDVVIPTDGLAAVFESFCRVDQFPRCKQPVAPIPSEVSPRIRMRDTELMCGEAAWMRLTFIRPLAARSFVERVAWRCMIVHANAFPEFAAEQRGDWHAERLA